MQRQTSKTSRRPPGFYKIILVTSYLDASPWLKYMVYLILLAFGFISLFQVQKSDAGKYTVKAKNSQGKKSCSATLSILGRHITDFTFSFSNSGLRKAYLNACNVKGTNMCTGIAEHIP